MALAFVATLVMVGLGTGLFAALYVWQGAPLSAIMAAGWAPGLWHFTRLGLLSALIWAPVMILSVAGLPRRWVRETW